MKIFSIATFGILVTSSSLLASEPSPWEFSLGGDVGTYNRSAYDYFGLSGGIGYKTICGTHSLRFGVGGIKNNESDSILYPDIESFSLAYRYSYPVSERFDIFAEIGAERLSWSETISDALGRPLSVGFDDTSFYLGVGTEVKLFEHLYLDASFRCYLSSNAVFESSAIGIDRLGNTVFLNTEAPNFLATIGLTFKF